MASLEGIALKTVPFPSVKASYRGFSKRNRLIGEILLSVISIKSILEEKKGEKANFFFFGCMVTHPWFDMKRV